MVRARAPAKALGKSRCPKLFKDISCADLDAADADVVLATAKKLLETGKKMAEKHDKASHRERNVLLEHRENWLPTPHKPWEREVIVKFLVTDVDEEAKKKSPQLAACVGRGHAQRLQKWLSLFKRMADGQVWALAVDAVLKDRGISPRVAAEAYDAGHWSYSSIKKIRKLNGETGTREKRRTGPSCVPTSYKVQMVNAALDLKAAELGLIKRSDGECWEADSSKIVNSTLELWGYQEAFNRRPTSVAWRPQVGPFSDLRRPMPSCATAMRLGRSR